MADRRTFRVLTSSQQSSIQSKKKTKSNAHTVQQIHIRQLQQYTRPTNNNYTQDNLKLATVHARQIRIQHVQKVKTPK